MTVCACRERNRDGECMYREIKRERECVCIERYKVLGMLRMERERENVRVERESVCVCVCVCVEIERDRVCVERMIVNVVSKELHTNSSYARFSIKFQDKNTNINTILAPFILDKRILKFVPFARVTASRL